MQQLGVFCLLVLSGIFNKLFSATTRKGRQAATSSTSPRLPTLAASPRLLRPLLASPTCRRPGSRYPTHVAGQAAISTCASLARQPLPHARAGQAATSSRRRRPGQHLPCASPARPTPTTTTTPPDQAPPPTSCRSALLVRIQIKTRLAPRSTSCTLRRCSLNCQQDELRTGSYVSCQFEL